MEKKSNLIELINKDGIKNMSDIEWKTETDGFKKESVKALIDGITDRPTKVLVIDAILDKWGYQKDWFELSIEMPFEEYCNFLKKSIENYDYFDVAAFKVRETNKVRQLQKDVKALKEAVFDCKIIIPDAILQELQNHGLIENATDRPLKWIVSKYFLAFFADEICKKADDECISKYKDKHKNNPFRKGSIHVVKPFETLFNVKNLSASKNDNQHNKGCNKESAECKTIIKILKSNNLFL